MCKIVCAFILMAVTVIAGLPAKDELMFDLGDDTAVVESTVREARAAVPVHIEDLLKPGVKEAFLHKYGDDEHSEGDAQGYHKRSQDKGNDGYKHFDSYHKKDGDKYGFETHSEYGKENKAKAGATDKSGKYITNYGDESEAEDEAETKKAYKVVEDGNSRKNGVRAVESYDDDTGAYDESSDSDGYYEDGGDDAGYSGPHYEEGYDESADDGAENYTGAEYEDGESDAESYDDDY